MYVLVVCNFDVHRMGMQKFRIVGNTSFISFHFILGYLTLVELERWYPSTKYALSLYLVVYARHPQSIVLMHVESPESPYGCDGYSYFTLTRRGFNHLFEYD